MLIFDFVTIGNKLYEIRKKTGLTQAQVAEAAGLSDRTYADIERGSVNMRIETILRICHVLHITPDTLFTCKKEPPTRLQDDLWQALDKLSPKEKETALQLLAVYINSLK